MTIISDTNITKHNIIQNIDASHTPVTTPVKQRSLQRSHEEMDHLIRALSHDMGANFMIIDHIFARIRKLTASYENPDLSETIQHMDCCLTQSKSLLHDLVTLGKSGSVDMEPEPLDTREIVDEVISQQRDLLEGRSIQVQVDGPLPTVECNRSRLSQIITNLIRNAAKHGCDPDEPRIEISARTENPQFHGESDEPLWAWLRIHDNGCGIPAQFREQVFEPGCRLPTTTADGSGFGLAIVRKIARYYGGDVTIDEHEPRGGTTFRIRLPACTIDAAVDQLADDFMHGREDNFMAQHPAEMLRIDGRDEPQPTRLHVEKPRPPRSRHVR